MVQVDNRFCDTGGVGCVEHFAKKATGVSMQQLLLGQVRRAISCAVIPVRACPVMHKVVLPEHLGFHLKIDLVGIAPVGGIKRGDILIV